MALSRTYFAAESKLHIGEKLFQRLEKCEKDEHTHADLYAHAYSHYYGQDQGNGITSAVTRKGEQGELAAIRINRARTFAKALLALVVGPSVAWKAQARSGDAGAARATSLGQQLLEDAWKTKGMAGVYQLWVEQTIVASHAFVFPEWDRGIGPPLMPDPRNPDRLIRLGDANLHNVLPWDVRYDSSRGAWKELDWKFVRLRKSRWDLAALYPRLLDGRSGDEAAEAILSAKWQPPGGAVAEQSDDEDATSVWYFMHDPRPWLPLGRWTVMLSPDVVLEDGPLTQRYDEVPLYRLAFDEMFGTPHGWTAFWDSLGAQELLDGIDTSLATNITTLGNPTIGYAKGSEVAPDKIGTGYSTWEYPPNAKPPAAIQLSQFPPEALKYRAELTGDQKQGFGLNDIALGQPQGAQMNAQAFAVLASMAVQQASPFQKSATEALSKLGTGYLKMMRRRVTRERVLEASGTGPGRRTTAQQWRGKDLAALNSVAAEVGNALEQTAQGRMALLQIYQGIPGVIRTPEQAVQVIETGRIESAVRATRDELHLVQSEYEMLQQGAKPTVHTHQNHLLHYRENAAVLLNRDALEDERIVRAVQEHLDEHYLEYFGEPPATYDEAGNVVASDPLRLPRQRFMLGQGPEPLPPGAMMPPPGEEGAPEGPPPPETGDELPAEALPPPGPGQADVGATPMPPNPLTGAPLSTNVPPIGA